MKNAGKRVCVTVNFLFSINNLWLLLFFLRLRFFRWCCTSVPEVNRQTMQKHQTITNYSRKHANAIIV